MLVDESILNGLDLSGYDREYRDIDTIELIKAAPGTTLAQTRVDLPHSLHTVTTVGMYRDRTDSGWRTMNSVMDDNRLLTLANGGEYDCRNTVPC